MHSIKSLYALSYVHGSTFKSAWVDFCVKPMTFSTETKSIYHWDKDIMRQLRNEKAV